MRSVVAVIDVGKTNKKLFLFDEQYKIVYERTAKFMETTDEDGDPCENLDALKVSVRNSVNDVLALKEFELKAINFSTYGASFVLLGDDTLPLTPLYNYLKPYPEKISSQFYAAYGGVEKVSLQTASPALGSLNSGLQLYRLKVERPILFDQVKYALHLPQYLSFLLTGKFYSDITSIGCHTALWDVNKNNYHKWVIKEGIKKKLAPILRSSQVMKANLPGHKYAVGVGLHDSSASLIPYLLGFYEPFVLISTGTWCISLNPFNDTPLTIQELEQDCLCYLSYQGAPVKASRLFAGHEHEEQIKMIAAQFNVGVGYFKGLKYEPSIVADLTVKEQQYFFSYSVKESKSAPSIIQRDWSEYDSPEAAYHQLMMDLVKAQRISTQLVINDNAMKRIFVDGGFSKNPIYMNLMAIAFHGMEVFAASMAQATAIGAALAVHNAWNNEQLPNDIIELKYYSITHDLSL